MHANATCTIQSQIGTNLYGEPTWTDPHTEVCAIVRLKPQVQHTTVRADGSMSRGHGDEKVLGFCRILLTPQTSARLGSLVFINLGVMPIKFKITSMEPRVDVLGPIDHYEVEGEQCP